MYSKGNLEDNHLNLVVITDFDWLANLKRDYCYDIVNLWTPTPWKLRRLNDKSLVYFLSKKMYGRKICGFGKFVAYHEFSIDDAWNKFGKANGVTSYEEFIKRVKKYTEANSQEGFKGNSHIIGCLLLTKVVLFDEDQMVEPEAYGWSIPLQVIKCKYVEEGSRNSIAFRNKHLDSFVLVKGVDRKQILNDAKNRVGQLQFREVLLEAYSHACCICGEKTVEVLEAAHIQEYRSKKSNHVQNGLLLRRDFHRLFDLGLITVTEDYSVRVSKYLTSEYYWTFNDRMISLPIENQRPSIEALRWHTNYIFRK